MIAFRLINYPEWTTHWLLKLYLGTEKSSYTIIWHQNPIPLDEMVQINEDELYPQSWYKEETHEGEATLSIACMKIVDGTVRQIEVRDVIFDLKYNDEFTFDWAANELYRGSIKPLPLGLLIAPSLALAFLFTIAILKPD